MTSITYKNYIFNQINLFLMIIKNINTNKQINFSNFFLLNWEKFLVTNFKVFNLFEVNRKEYFLLLLLFNKKIFNLV